MRDTGVSPSLFVEPERVRRSRRRRPLVSASGYSRDIRPRSVRLKTPFALSLGVHLLVFLVVAILVRPHYEVPKKIHSIPIQLISLSSPSPGRVVRETPATAPPREPQRTTTPPVPKKPGKVVVTKKDPAAAPTARKPEVRRQPDRPKVGAADSSRVGRTSLPAVGDMQGSMQLRVEGEPLAYSYYFDVVQRKIAASWFPPAELARSGGEVAAQIRFRIDRDGVVPNRYVEEPSGSSSFDISALRALDEAAPLPPLPPEYSGDHLIFHLRFVYTP